MHGVRGALGGVPAREPGFFPDLCPHARPSPPVFTPRKHSSDARDGADPGRLRGAGERHSTRRVDDAPVPGPGAGGPGTLPMIGQVLGLRRAAPAAAAGPGVGAFEVARGPGGAFVVEALPCLADNYQYLVHHGPSRSACFVDAVDAPALLARARELDVGMDRLSVLSTHHRADHTGGPSAHPAAAAAAGPPAAPRRAGPPARWPRRRSPRPRAASMLLRCGRCGGNPGPGLPGSRPGRCSGDLGGQGRG